VTNSNGIFADQNLFNQESHDFLAFNHTKGFRSTAQASKECCEGFWKGYFSAVGAENAGARRTRYQAQRTPFSGTARRRAEQSQIVSTQPRPD
jgi:hypothetical protein